MAVSRNDVTGDKIQSRHNAKYTDNYDAIFRRLSYSDTERYQFIRSVMLDLSKQKQCEGFWFAEPNTEAEFDSVVDAMITNLRK